jgi:hypothetical protein
VLAFFWPDVHDDLDWSRDAEALEQEFRAQAPQAEEGKRVVDKLLRIFQKGSGDPRYLHVEAQARFEAGFARRVYVYNYRAEDRFGQPVVSLVILLDEDPAWLPAAYEAELYGTRRTLTFRSVKVINWRDRRKELEESANPVGLFVLAYLEGRRVEGDHEALAAVKLDLLSRLPARLSAAEEARPWFIYLDWLLPLPREYNRRVWEQFESLGGKAMDFMSYPEERGFEKGQRVGLLKAVKLGLDLKFGSEGLALLPEMEQIEDLATLEAVSNAIKPAASLDEIRKLIPAPK